MAYAVFSNFLSYDIGDTVTYEGYVYVFIVPHVPGGWDKTQVVQINPYVAYQTVQDFNTLPDYNLSTPLAAPKYTVQYHINNDSMILPSTFAVDTVAYNVGEVAVVQGHSYQHFSEDGVWVYTFAGWSLGKNLGDTINYVAGTEIIITNHDVHLYAQWIKTPTINVDDTGTMTLNPLYKDSLIKLIIPEYFGGSRIKIIGADAFLNSSIDEIVIPPSIIEIKSTAFYGWSGTTLRLVDAEVTTKYPALKLNADCFDNTPNLTEIIIPYRWREATGILFPAQFKDTLTIKIRNTKLFMEEQLSVADAEAYIADASDPDMNYERLIYWGYND